MIARLVALGLALAVAACSETTWRHDTYREVTIEGMPLKVSWIALQPGELDIVVTGRDDRSPIEPAIAVKGAKWLAVERGWGDHFACADRAPAAQRYGAIAQTRFAFRCIADGK